MWSYNCVYMARVHWPGPQRHFEGQTDLQPSSRRRRRGRQWTTTTSRHHLYNNPQLHPHRPSMRHTRRRKKWNTWHGKVFRLKGGPSDVWLQRTISIISLFFPFHEIIVLIMFIVLSMLMGQSTLLLETNIVSSFLGKYHAFRILSVIFMLILPRFTGTAGQAVITRNSAYLFADSRYWLQAADEVDNNWTRTSGVAGWTTGLDRMVCGV